MRQFISVSFLITLAFILVKSGSSENLKNEIFIESDSMHIDELKSISTFSGNVILKYGELSLSSDKIIITRKNNNISKSKLLVPQHRLILKIVNYQKIIK